ncbi:MAG: hypothetical protein EOP45_17995 [Sphingobacteriaceae bacterium]|nr:MAG: hypothetical protein EOP45_17995 [Sphingobacteriaceae bacterium]
MNNKLTIITCFFFSSVFAQTYINYADESLPELHNEIIMNTSSWYETCPHKKFFEPIPFIQGANVDQKNTKACGGATTYRTVPTLYYENDTPFIRLEAEHKHSDTSDICITSVESDTQIFQTDFQRISMTLNHHIVKVKTAPNFWRLRTGRYMHIS